MAQKMQRPQLLVLKAVMPAQLALQFLVVMEKTDHTEVVMHKGLERTQLLLITLRLTGLHK
jgi:hypothetical protein